MKKTILILFLGMVVLPCFAISRITVTVRLPKGDDSTKVTVYARHDCKGDTLLPKKVEKNVFTFYIKEDVCFIATSDAYRPEVIYTIPIGNGKPQDLYIKLKKKKGANDESEAEYINRMVRELTTHNYPEGSTVTIHVNDIPDGGSIGNGKIVK